MLEMAKQKLQSEMDQNKANGYIQFIGQELLNYLKENPGSASEIMSEGKTIAKSLSAMEVEARKKPRTGNCAMITPDEGMKIILQYFGISMPDVKQHTSQITNDTAKPADNFNIRLEDLL